MKGTEELTNGNGDVSAVLAAKALSRGTGSKLSATTGMSGQGDTKDGFPNGAAGSYPHTESPQHVTLT